MTLQPADTFTPSAYDTAVQRPTSCRYFSSLRMILHRAGFSVSAELFPIHITMQNLITLGLNVCAAKNLIQETLVLVGSIQNVVNLSLSKSTNPKTLVHHQVILYAASQTVTKT